MLENRCVVGVALKRCECVGVTNRALADTDVRALVGHARAPPSPIDDAAQWGEKPTDFRVQSLSESREMAVHGTIVG